MSRRLLASYLALTFAVLVALEVPLAIVNARAERRDLTAKVERDAFAAASLAEDSLQSGKTSPTLQALATRYRRSTGGRIVIVDRRGRSIADSAPTTPGERLFGSRPEIAAALRGSTVDGIRSSADVAPSLALCRRASRLGRARVRRRADHVSHVDARQPDEPVPALAARSRTGRSRCRHR